MKKVFKIIGITLLTILLLLIAIPFAFQSKIKEVVKRTINENLNAHVEFSDVNLSFIRSFPQAQVNVSDLVITNFEPFKDETLATAKSISLNMSVKELFKKASDEPIVINKINIDEALITLKTNKRGETNYDILKDENKDENKDEKENSSAGFTLDVKDYSIDNSAITYLDESSNTTFYITEFNHSGKGKFSETVSELETKTESRISLRIDSTDYLSNNELKLDALIDLDLDNNKYTFKENKAFINKLPLEFHGYVQLLEAGQDIDITFENPGSDFRDFLAIIPETYSKNIEDVQTTGNFKLKGMIKGLLTDETIPNLDIQVSSNNASFKYPDLPKRVDNITINAAVKNTTGKSDDTYIDINAFNFKIDQDAFKSSATLKNITKNMLINADIDGVLNLANLTKAYPIKLEKELSGILKAKLNTAFDMNAIETNAYERIKNNGSASITDFIFSSEDMVNPIHIKKANMTFNPGTVSLNNFDAVTGKSDLHANGTIKNLLGFLLSDNKLQGNFNVNSNLFIISDFMVESKTASNNNKTTSKKESLKIPEFLDCTIQADAKTVVYDNLNLENVQGTLVIKDQQATLKNMTTNIFNGKLAVIGNVSTQKETPTFNINLGAENFDISKAFKDLDLLQALAPIAKILEGKLNSTISLSGSLDKEFTPDLTTVSGNAFAELLTTDINTEDSKILSLLGSTLKFIDFNKLDLKDLKTNLTFKDGLVNLKPFTIKYEDIDIHINGAHGFDKNINYNVVLDVPAKYLGSDINRLIGKINDPKVNKISIPVTANITGSFNNPNVKTDLSSAVTKLTKQLIEIEKQKLLDQGSNAIKDFLQGITEESNSANQDSTFIQTDTIKTNNTINNGIKDILGGLLSGKKNKKDSIK
ncbi:AsmA family protein [Xanthomarina spongicola]|uniref:AsmA-like protein n=1 Tax=Xanthomarina spongicola TaxID=570520 RepID=A0A316DSF3_9FLAO|nr:AsmA-like C-terminal region-containing protein [Xanthomarina spongicola]PWK20954.1 AsmA-like protein [Xanthomarina spongicola]